jgi:hypothetical protein
MSGPAALACLVLTVALVLASLVLLVRAGRRHDPTRDLLGLMAMIAAGVPAAVYGVAAG